MKFLKWSLWIIIGILVVVLVGAYGWLPSPAIRET